MDERINDCILIKPFVKEVLKPALHLTFAGCLYFSCYSAQLLQDCWTHHKDTIIAKRSPFRYLIKLLSLSVKERPENFSAMAKDKMFEVYSIPFDAELAEDDPTDRGLPSPASLSFKNQQQGAVKKAPQAFDTKSLVRDLDIELEYWKFEEAKNGKAAYLFPLMKRSFNPFAARMVSLYYDGKTKQTPLAEHLTEYSDDKQSTKDFVRSILTHKEQIPQSNEALAWD